MSWVVKNNNVVVEHGDDVTRQVTYWDDFGLLITSTPEAPNPRPYTPDEIALIAASNDANLAREARRQQRTLVSAMIADLQLEKDRVQPIIDKLNADLTLSDIKAVARAVKRIADADIDLAKFIKDMV